MNNKNKKTLFIDKWLFNLIDNHLFEIGVFLLIVISVIIRIFFTPITDCSADYDTYYKTWTQTYKEIGIMKGLSQTIGDYYVPLNLVYALAALTPWEPYVAISAFSCIFEYIGAFFVYKLFAFLYPSVEKKIVILSSILCLFLPAMMFNSSLWKQCDSIYVCFLIISLYYMVKDKASRAFIFLGIAFSIKLQAIFLIPLYLIIYIAKKSYSILQFLWLPLIFLIAGIPCIIAGRGIRATYFTYFAQMGEGTSECYGMVSNFPNIYNFGLDNYYDQLHVVAVLVVLAIMITSAIFCKANKDKLISNNGLLVYMGLWLIWTMLMFMPGMHERYDYFLVMIFTAYAVIVRRKMVLIAVILNVINIITYANAIFTSDIISIAAISIIYIAAYLFVTADLFGNCFKLKKE